MAFFPRTIYNTEASIAPLFRLFEEIDSQSRQSKCQSQSQARCAPRRAPAAPAAPAAPVRRWQPRFDVRETDGAYHLYGELPGLSKEDISIEFPEHQQVIVRGKTERNYTAAPAAPTPTPVAESESEPVAESISDDTSSRHSHQATVEDDSEDEDNFEVIEDEKTKQPEVEADEDEDESMTEAEDEKTQPQTQTAPAEERSRFWLRERSIGHFARGFSFPERIEQDEVTASLKDGILTVTVPKSKPHEPRHVTVN